MAVKTRRKETGDSYMELVRRFPLRPIRSEAELDRAIQMVDSLLDRETLDKGAEDYLDVLGDLVRKYETENYPPSPVPDSGMLRHLIESKGVSQSLVAKETGIAISTVSEVLAGKRRLNRKHITKLSGYFGVDPGVFHRPE